MSKRLKYVIGVVLVIAAIGGFAAFRPDTLFTDRTVDEQLDPGVASALAATTSAPEPTTAPPASTQASTVETTQAPPTTAPEPTLVSTGTWASIEHETTGTVSLVVDGTKSTLVLQELATSNGPDLVVYLSPVASDAAGDLTAGAISLGPLKGNVGTQTYDVPAGTDLSEYASVVIWCDRFSVGFAAAALDAV